MTSSTTTSDDAWRMTDTTKLGPGAVCCGDSEGCDVGCFRSEAPVVVSEPPAEEKTDYETPDYGLDLEDDEE
jgi:hypothetical protein